MQKWFKLWLFGGIVALAPAVVFWDVSASFTWSQAILSTFSMFGAVFWGIAIMTPREQSCQKEE